MTLEPPEFVIVPELVWLVPIETFPKPMLAGAAVNEPVVAPVPLSGTVIVEPEFLLLRLTLEVRADESMLIEMAPLALPFACGANMTPQLTLCPAARVRGRVRPLSLKPVPVTVAWETLRLLPPELVRVKACV